MVMGLIALLWLLGLALRSSIMVDPFQQVPVLDPGGWRYTRHPSYFGDAAW